MDSVLKLFPKSNPWVLNSSQYLDVARTLEGYATVVFPHCGCDARRNGHVIVSISLNSLLLQACSTQGEKEVSEKSFIIQQILSYCSQYLSSVYIFCDVYAVLKVGAAKIAKKKKKKKSRRRERFKH